MGILDGNIMPTVHHLKACQEDDQRRQPRQMALHEQVAMIKQERLVGEGRQQSERPGSDDDKPRPEHSRPAARSRTMLLLIIVAGHFQRAHRAPPSSYQVRPLSGLSTFLV
jgi:hypothetical protein